jgi:hypothetical protein
MLVYNKQLLLNKHGMNMKVLKVGITRGNLAHVFNTKLQ